MEMQLVAALYLNLVHVRAWLPFHALCTALGGTALGGTALGGSNLRGSNLRGSAPLFVWHHPTPATVCLRTAVKVDKCQDEKRRINIKTPFLDSPRGCRWRRCRLRGFVHSGRRPYPLSSTTPPCLSIILWVYSTVGLCLSLRWMSPSEFVRVALQLRSLRLHIPRLCRCAVFQ